MENKSASLLAVPLAKALSGVRPSWCGRCRGVAGVGGGILDKLYVIFFLIILNNHYFAISLTC